MMVMDPPGRRFTCRSSVFACEPKYRILRAIYTVARIPVLRHAELRERLCMHWHCIRTHSSWSRA